MGLKSILVVLVGPQGTGKTTQAYRLKLLRSLGLNMRITDLTTATTLYHVFHKLIAKLRPLYGRFYDDMEITRLPAPEILLRLMTLACLLRLIGGIISLIKLYILKLFYNIIIEHEGFIFKSFADLFYELHYLSKYSSGPAKMNRKVIDFTTTLLLRAIPKYTIMVCFNTPHKVLKERYVLKRTHVEPRDYIEIQRMVYTWFAKYHNCLIIDTSVSDIETTQRLIREYIVDRMSISSCP
jgi:thymidylate kinase